MPTSNLAQVFKDAALAVYAYREHGECEEVPIEFAIEGIQKLKTGIDTAAGHLKVAFNNLYGGKCADLQEVRRELDEEEMLLVRIKNKEQLSRPESARTMGFCQELWVQLRLYENGSMPHNIRK